MAGLATARGDTVRVHKVVRPLVALSSVTVAGDDADNTCWPANCLPRAGAGVAVGQMPALPDGGVLVGFDHFYLEGTKPCNCWSYRDAVVRGTILFKTDDIPHHFKAATLVLQAMGSTVSDPATNVLPLTGIFETSAAAQPQPGVGGDLRFDPASGQITALHEGENRLFPMDPVSSLKPVPGAFGFPARPYPQGAVMAEPTTFSYRIDVTSTVVTWMADWLHRDQTPLRGFILVGTDESFPQQSNTQFAVSYLVTLEFDIDEPDL
jgi:hypothetical protein